MSNKLIDKKKLDEIDLIVSNLLSKYDETDYDFKKIVRSICLDENIDLCESDLKDLSGLLYKNPDTGRWVIVVNSKDSTSRKLFTIGHELGHYFLHKEENEEFIDGGFSGSIYTRDESGKFQCIELEANEFAGSLVMPKERIFRIIPNQDTIIGNQQITDLANVFGVSVIAMSTRLKNLGYKI